MRLWHDAVQAKRRKAQLEPADTLLYSNMIHQQNLTRFRIAIVTLRARNRLADTRPLMPKVLAILPTLQPGTLTVISA
jgi:hypothetical protein